MIMYETPELFEIGDVETLTLGRQWGDVPDGRPDCVMFFAVEDLDDDEDAQ